MGPPPAQSHVTRFLRDALSGLGHRKTCACRLGLVLEELPRCLGLSWGMVVRALPGGDVCGETWISCCPVAIVFASPRTLEDAPG